MPSSEFGWPPPSSIFSGLIPTAIGMGAGANDMVDEDVGIIPADEKFSLGFYPPALALVVTAPSRYRPTVTNTREAALGGAGGYPALQSAHVRRVKLSLRALRALR